MLKSGFTTVGEFHYLHHDVSGRPYANPAEMSERILGAADGTGICLTLLPVLYSRGGIDQPPLPEQRRFIFDGDGYARFFGGLAAKLANHPRHNLGLAPHSLRAVTKHDLTQVIAPLAASLPGAPIHIHVSEQVREVDEVVTGLGARPGEWLMDNVDFNARWTLIHATHFDDLERQRLAASGAIAGLCPATEAGLGDGIFPLASYSGRGGAWGIGTDSNARISVAEELRILAFGQRLASLSMRVLAQPTGSLAVAQPGRQLYDLALDGGTRSLHHPVGAIVVGARADLVVLDPIDPALVGHGPGTVLDGWIFSGTSSAVRDVYVAGRRVVHDRHHEREDEIFAQFRMAIDRLA
jgi:formimidoylglutamate deiminase